MLMTFKLLSFILLICSVRALNFSIKNELLKAKRTGESVTSMSMLPIIAADFFGYKYSIR